MSKADPFADLPREHYGAILADPPWAFQTYSGPAIPTTAMQHYETMSIADICELPVGDRAAKDAVLFLWVTWPTLGQAWRVIEAWGFEYKTCAFSWMKADATQIELFSQDMTAVAGMGYWTLSNSEVCLLATRGRPKRLKADVRQGIITPRREHSRKPHCVHERIERLVAGPYLELFARAERPGWTVWGDEVGKFKPANPTWDEMWQAPLRASNPEFKA
jgi:N6-adenosine-specific RNA methylase IME4